jgi:hypothetical protein
MADLTAAQARELTDLAKESTADLRRLVRGLWEGRAWLALDYPTWTAYCRAELPELGSAARRDMVAELHEAGASQRAIAGATRLSRNTVAREVAELPPHDKVVGTDGSVQPVVKRPPTPQQVAPAEPPAPPPEWDDSSWLGYVLGGPELARFRQVAAGRGLHPIDLAAQLLHSVLVAKTRPEPQRPAKVDGDRCPSCGGRLMTHGGRAQCTVPGCGWHAKAKP